MKERIRILRPCHTPNIGEWGKEQIIALTPETQHLLDQGFAERYKERRNVRNNPNTEDIE